MQKMLNLKTKIIFNKQVKEKYFHCMLAAPSLAKNAIPGQFLNIKTSDKEELLLRRPFGIHKVRGKNIEILYEVLGKGTEALSGRRAGEYLDVIGPLGSGFNHFSLPTTRHSPILVAGGMGVAPLVFLAERLKKQKPIVLIGAKTKKQILCIEEFKKFGCSVKIATDDGSLGFHGRVSQLLKEFLRLTINQERITIYACGPKPMLKEIAHISKKQNISAQVSLEEHMACGIGACLGCVVNTTKGYKRVCKEGPVFKADEIIWG